MDELFVLRHLEDKKKRGAKVYGLPVAKPIASYMDDVSSVAAEARIWEMFLAGEELVPYQIHEDGEY